MCHTGLLTAFYRMLEFTENITRRLQGYLCRYMLHAVFCLFMKMKRHCFVYVLSGTKFTIPKCNTQKEKVHGTQWEKMVHSQQSR